MYLCTSCAKWECLPEDLFCSLCGHSLRHLEIVPPVLSFVDTTRGKARRLLLRNNGLIPLQVSIGQHRTSREWLRLVHPDADKKKVSWTRRVASVEDGTLLPHPHFDAEIVLAPGIEYGVDVHVEGRLAIPERDLTSTILLSGEGLSDAAGAPMATKHIPVTWGAQADPRLAGPADVVCRLGGAPTSFDVRLVNPRRGFVTLNGPPKAAVDWIRVRDYPTDPIGPTQEGIVTFLCDVNWAPQGVHKVEITAATFELDKPLSTLVQIQVRRPPNLLINRTHVNLGELTPFSQVVQPLVLENRGEEDLVLRGEPIIEPVSLRSHVTVRDEDPSHRRIKSARDRHPGKVILLTISARDLPTGAYEGTLKVASNDPSPETPEVGFSFTVQNLPLCDRLLALDFGTSNCCIAVADNPGSYRTLDLSGGGRTPVKEIPTVVHFRGPGEFAIGEEAKNTQQASPDRTVSSIKRRLGSRRPLKILGQEYSPTQIATIIIRQLWERAAVALKQAPHELVVTVPCQFGKTAIENLLEACRNAGFAPHVEQRFVLDEPSAAAYRHVIVNRKELVARGPEHRVIVYDFGGGTLDIALLEVKFGANPLTYIRVLEVDGVELGGDDLDDELLELYFERMREDQERNPKSKLARLDLNRIVQVAEGEADLDVLSNRILLRRAAEDVKKLLSTQESAPFPTVTLKDRLQASIYLDSNDEFLTVRREQFEERIAPRLAEARTVIEKLFERVKISPTAVDVLLLTGGSSQIPLVHKTVGSFFPRAYVPSPKEAPPKESVALGAVIHGYLAKYEMSSLSQGSPGVVIEPMRDRARFSLGTLNELGEFRQIVPRGGLPLWGEYPICLPSRAIDLPLVRNNGTANRAFLETRELTEVGKVRIDPAMFPGTPPGAKLTLNLWLYQDRTLEATIEETRLPTTVSEGALQ